MASMCPINRLGQTYFPPRPRTREEGGVEATPVHAPIYQDLCSNRFRAGFSPGEALSKMEHKADRAPPGSQCALSRPAPARREGLDIFHSSIIIQILNRLRASNTMRPGRHEHTIRH